MACSGGEAISVLRARLTIQACAAGCTERAGEQSDHSLGGRILNFSGISFRWCGFVTFPSGIMTWVR